MHLTISKLVGKQLIVLVQLFDIWLLQVVDYNKLKKFMLVGTQ